ncbi:MAG TPA: hypothetical protein VF458_02385 [Ktedonobacteraceae bacterium]
MFKHFVSWTIASWRRIVEPDFGADHYPLHAGAPVRHPDDRQDALPNQPRGYTSDDFLAGIPRSVAPNETLAGFPRRAAMVYYHGWRIPTPPRLPVYD